MIKYHNINDAVYYMERVFKISGSQLKICGNEGIVGDVEILASKGDCFIEVDKQKQLICGKTPIILNPWSLYHYSGEGLLRTRYLVFEGAELDKSLGIFINTPLNHPHQKMRELIFDIIQSPKAIKVQNRKHSEVAEDLKDLIDHNYLSGTKLSGLQQSKGFHPTVSGRLFKDRFGTSPKQYLQRLQVLQGLKNLIKTSSPLIDTAFDAGFNDVSRFYKNFNKIVGTSPGKVRSQGPVDQRLVFSKELPSA